jgi:SAM-dependent methyltransferase
MEIAEYRRLREQEQGYWWHVGKRALISAMLRWGVPPDANRRGLDIGCGAGGNLPHLAAYGRFFGTEVTAELYGPGMELPERPVVLARGEALPFADGSLSICTFFDVLEHVEREDDLLGEVHRVLRPGGWVFLSVPAYPFLWSEHDVSLHHFRRYVRTTLVAALRRNRFTLVRATYAFASTFPGVAAVRLLKRAFARPGGPPQTSYVTTPEPLNSLLIRVLELEAKWLAWGDLPFGTSLFALARKESGGAAPPIGEGA